MEISSYIFDNAQSKPNYYCCFNDQECLFHGTIHPHVLDNYDSYSIGEIILSIIDNYQTITKIITKYINIIANVKCSNNEDDNHVQVLMNLESLQKFLKKKFKVFKYIDFVNDICCEYVKSLEVLNTEKEKFNSRESQIEYFKDVFKLPYTRISYLSEDNNLRKEKIGRWNNITFKDFTLYYLYSFLSCLDHFRIGSISFFEQNNNYLSIKKKNWSDKIEHVLSFQEHYNSISNNSNISLLKIAFIHNNKIYFRDSNDIKNYSFKDLHMLQFFEFNNLIDLFYLSLLHMIDKKVLIKKCKNCGRYFIPKNRSDEVYCSRISPQCSSKTCKQYGVHLVYRQTIKSQPIKQAHYRIGQFYRMRITRAKTENEKNHYENLFDDYKRNYQKKKNEYKDGHLSESDFVKWIYNQENSSNTI